MRQLRDDFIASGVLQQMRGAAAVAGVSGVAGARHGNMRPLRRLANLGGVQEPVGASMAGRLERTARRAGARRSQVTPPEAA